MPFLHSSRQRLSIAALSLSLVVNSASGAPLLAQEAPAESSQTLPMPTKIFGFRDFTQEQAHTDQAFLAVPSAQLAGEALKTLTAVPHVAGSKEDYATAVYVADKFKAAGLDTHIVPYKAWLNLPTDVHFTATSSDGKLLVKGPKREHVAGDPFQDDPRILPPFNGSSASGEVTGDVVYANYGRPEDFKQLKDLGVELRGKIVLVRYGENFRGVKVYIAQQYGAAGVIIYSDPADDGYFQGDKYPKGPFRPDSGVQRGSVQYMFKYPGDALTPGVASTPELSAGKRLKPADVTSMPTIPSMPISYADATPILEQLGGAEAPRTWQGALPFNYHVGGAQAVALHMVVKQSYTQTTIWDVIGSIPGTEHPDEWVVAGNHRDAWVFGAVDPSSGTAAMLETVHGLGVLRQQGWKPKRTIYVCSWDAEEEGLIGSTEWVEDHAAQMHKAVAYFNTDVGVAGPNFEASAVPSLKRFIRELTGEVPSPKGGSVYDAWLKEQNSPATRERQGRRRTPAADAEPGQVTIGDLGSGSDYTPFLQHAGVPSTDIGSGGKYGVYHSVFDNYAWFTKFADPTFVYEQQQARVFGLEILHMADADVLPYDYVAYARSIASYISAEQGKANSAGMNLNFGAVLQASDKLLQTATATLSQQQSGEATPAFNTRLRSAETAFLNPAGLPGRGWFKHTIYAPGEYTGYAAVVIPGVSEAIEAKDAGRAQSQLSLLAEALHRADVTLEGGGE